MVEIFRMQLRQVLAGRKKWLMLVFAALPVLLTWMTLSSAGGLASVRGKIDGPPRVRAEPEPPSPGARRVVSTGMPIALLDGRIQVWPDHVMLDGLPFARSLTMNVNRGYLVIEDGVVWLDESRERNDGRVRMNIHGRNEFADALQQLDRPWATLTAGFLFLLFPQTICLLLALLYGASIPGAELEGRTLTYLFTRPVARWRIVLGKYLAITAAMLPPTVLSITVAWLVLGQPGGIALLAALVGATAGALLCYGAIFILFGFLAPRRAMVLALLYGVIFEFVLSMVPAMVNTATVTYYLRSLVVEALQLDLPAKLARVVGGASLTTSLCVLLLMIVVPLALASRLAARREYVIAGDG